MIKILGHMSEKWNGGLSVEDAGLVARLKDNPRGLDIIEIVDGEELLPGVNYKRLKNTLLGLCQIAHRGAWADERGDEDEPCEFGPNESLEFINAVLAPYEKEMLSIGYTNTVPEYDKELDSVAVRVIKYTSRLSDAVDLIDALEQMAEKEA